MAESHVSFVAVVLGVAAALNPACKGRDVADGPARPSVLLITLDTTRADHLGAYGYARPTSPNLDELAAESTVYENAYSTSSWTLPAHASLFTGRYPSSHGARHDPAGGLLLADGIDVPAPVRARAMARGERTLASVLADEGFATAAVVAGPWLIQQFGLATGFDHYDDADILNANGRRANQVTDAALEWLATVPEPFFLFLNYFDPHSPYMPPGAWARSFLPRGVVPNVRSAGQATARYDAEILFMDDQIGRLFRALRESGRWDRTLVVVTGDHGEFLGDRDLWGHERFLWEPLVRVPLIVKPAGSSRPGRREQRRMSVVDVLPMVLERIGVDVPEGVQGTAAPGSARPVLAEVHPMSGKGLEHGAWKASWEGSSKFLRNSLGQRYLFDLEDDPDEMHNLAATEPERAARAERALDQAFAALPPPGFAAEVVVDDRTREALEQLGYLEETSSEARSHTRMEASE